MQHAMSSRASAAAPLLPADAVTRPEADPAATPRAVRWGATLAIGGLVLGAVYLMIVRGDALLLDLSALSRYAYCF